MNESQRSGSLHCAINPISSVCSETTLSPPFLYFLVSQLTIRERERVEKSTQALSKWFKRDVRGLQHMVGSDFLMQIGKDQIKAA